MLNFTAMRFVYFIEYLECVVCVVLLQLRCTVEVIVGRTLSDYYKCLVKGSD